MNQVQLVYTLQGGKRIICSYTITPINIEPGSAGLYSTRGRQIISSYTITPINIEPASTDLYFTGENGLFILILINRLRINIFVIVMNR